MPKKPQPRGYFTDEELRASGRGASAPRTDTRKMSGQRYVPKSAAPATRPAQSGARPSAQTAARQTAARSAPQRQTANRPSPRQAQAPARQTARPRPAQRPVLSEAQRAAYERAYYQKYGRLPYKSAAPRAPETRKTAPAPQTRKTAPAPRAPRADRRQAFLESERERRIKEAAEKRRLEAERLKAEAEAARLAAEREEKRRRELERDLERRRRERENLRRYEAERKKLEERRRAERAERRRAEEEAREKLKRRRRRNRIIKLHFKIFLLALLAGAALFGFAGYRYFWSDGTDKSGKVTYYYDGEKAYSAPAELAYSAGRACLDFTSVAEHFGFYTAGDKNSIKYVIPGDGELTDNTVEFVLGSTTAVVNGTPVPLSVASRYVGSDLWVSCDIGDFFESGISIRLDGGRVDVERVKVQGEDGKAVRDGDGNYVYEDVSLRYRPMAEPGKVDLVALYGEAAKGLGKGSAVTFKSDLSAYEDFMNPADSNEYITVVGKDAPLDVTYIPEDLTLVADTRADGREARRMRYVAEKALEAMFIEMRAEGFDDVSVTAAFVSYYEQSGLFASYVNEEMAGGMTEDEAKAAVRAYCDEAGYCDLQTGLTAVLHNLDEASVEFENEPAFKWLEENAWKFGFVIRYPQGKSDITGHAYDPCEFRFVGRFAAEIMRKNGWSLEEYLLS